MRMDLYHKLKTLIPVNILKEMTYEEMKKHFDAMKKQEEEEEEKLKKEKDKQKEEVKQNDINMSENEIREMIIVNPEEPLDVEPLDQDVPQINNWTIYFEPKKVDKIRLLRIDGSESLWTTLQEIFRKCSRADVEQIYAIGLEKGLDDKIFDINNLTEKITWEWLKMMFQPQHFPDLFGRFRSVHSWKYFAMSGVHQVSMTDGTVIFMLTDKEYDMNISLLRSLKMAKLDTSVNNEVARNLIYMICNQLHRKEMKKRKDIDLDGVD